MPPRVAKRMPSSSKPQFGPQPRPDMCPRTSTATIDSNSMAQMAAARCMWSMTAAPGAVRPRDLLDELYESRVRQCPDTCPDHLRICGPRRTVTASDGSQIDTWMHRFIAVDWMEARMHGVYDRDIDVPEFVSLQLHYTQLCHCCRAAGVQPGQRAPHPH